MSVLITIGIPVYNVELYVRESIVSALEQDFSLPYEVLVVDDCGTDNSMDIVNDLVRNHPKGNLIRIIHHHTNKGLGLARNTIIDNAEGSYLAFLDSDDRLEPTALSCLYEAAEKTGSEITVGEVTNVRGGSQWCRQHYPEMTVHHEHAGSFLLAQNACIPHIEWWGKLWSVQFLRSKGIRCVHRIMEDSIPDAIALLEATCISMISNNVYFYNIREGSILSESHSSEGKDETILIYTDIFHKLQAIISDRYKDAPGVFDLYMLRVRYNMKALALSRYSSSQIQLLDKELSGYLNVVPGLCHLHNKHDRLVLFCCRSKQTFERYLYITQVFSKTVPGRILRNLLFLIPCKRYSR